MPNAYDLPAAATALAAATWGVFPLADGGKFPRAGCPDCQAPLPSHDPASCRHEQPCTTPAEIHGVGRCRDRRCQTPKCPGPHVCGHELCHGVLDASSDPEIAADRWRRFPRANIGLAIPAGLFVVDIDPRHGGDAHLTILEQQYEPLPGTLTTISGRGDGGEHRFLRRPPGKLSAVRLRNTGVDLKTPGSYCVAPPSVHPSTGQPYRWVDPDVPPAEPPRWLVDLVTATAPTSLAKRPAPRQTTFSGTSIADTFTSSASWTDILYGHGWTCLDLDGDDDGARWRHPTATAPISATIRNGCLFVYSSNTPFEQTTTGDQHGYTRFRAYAVLNHAGDLSAAARALRKGAA
ncbi:bifunctional DNA primase/polymerase [Nonomuraea guangzhouensis]|uniref:Bifunctional DNA primase/polymerase n=1 Tax=Nonomuraea guangzhouensis TaxID=1291555 RepID=A0ABW4H0I3_9ACTN|nr:bifunctional DNA primase/polymerase [Nonomuraea guangzhouensis]